MTLPPQRQAELQRVMDEIARRLLDERLDREAGADEPSDVAKADEPDDRPA